MKRVVCSSLAVLYHVFLSQIKVNWSTLQILFPASLPNLAIALRLAAAHAILAAMIAEFLMGTNGLGYLFAVTKQEFLTERAFGTSVIATVISVIAFLASSHFEIIVKKRFTQNNKLLRESNIYFNNQIVHVPK